MKKLYFTVLCALLFLPASAMAQNTQLTNPLGAGFTDPRLIIARVIQAALSISGSIALLMFVYGGFLWMTSGGNEGMVDKGKKVILWATLGIVLIASAYAITTAIFQGLTTGSVSVEATTPTQ